MTKRKWLFGAFAEKGKRGWKVRLYSLWYSSEWDGYVGDVEVAADSRAEAMKRARALVVAKLNAAAAERMAVPNE